MLTALRRRERRSRQLLRHGRLTVPAWPGQGREELRMNFASRGPLPLFQEAGTLYCVMDEIEMEVLAVGARPAGLAEPRGAAQLVRHRGCHEELLPLVLDLNAPVPQMVELFPSLIGFCSEPWNRLEATMSSSLSRCPSSQLKPNLCRCFRS